MKKLLTAILTLALVLAVLGGCGKKSETMTLYT